MHNKSSSFLVASLAVSCFLIATAVEVCGETIFVADSAGGNGIWQWTHAASGSGSANVYDGGPTEVGDGTARGPNNTIMVFGASDSTMLGSFGARASASGRSRILSENNRSLRFRVNFNVGYNPSLQSGGDNPGGEAEGELLSVIEFRMPANQISWSYQLNFQNTFPLPFAGTAEILVENVTQSAVVLELDSEIVPGILTDLQGNSGDMIRVTSMMSGSGSMGPGSPRNYGVILDMIFSVPEPGTFLILLPSLFLCARKRRARSR